jgi:hypothetical protein
MTATNVSPERQHAGQPRDKKEPNLGQKQARQQRRSESELQQMGDQNPANPSDKESSR